MSSQANHENPIISNSLISAAVLIHIAICVITIKFDAVLGSGYLDQSFVSNTFMMLFKPFALALLITPFVVLARHSSFWPEFRPLLFITIGADIFLTLWEMVGL